MRIRNKMIDDTQPSALSTKKSIKLTSCLVLIAYCLVLISSQGCIYRNLTVKTDPPGALVYLNDRLMGETPLEHNFLWYGWYRVKLRKAGYEQLNDRRRLRAPFYFWIPLDLVMELVPFRISDSHTWEYKLEPHKDLPEIHPPDVSAQTSTIKRKMKEKEKQKTTSEAVVNDYVAGKQAEQEPEGEEDDSR